MGYETYSVICRACLFRRTVNAGGICRHCLDTGAAHPKGGRLPRPYRKKVSLKGRPRPAEHPPERIEAVIRRYAYLMWHWRQQPYSSRKSVRTRLANEFSLTPHQVTYIISTYKNKIDATTTNS